MTHDEFLRHQLLQDYLDGKLDPEATIAFEQRIASDPGLSEEVRLLRQMRDTYKPEDEQVIALRQTLKEVRTEQPTGGAVKTHDLPRRNFRWLGLAAALLLLVSFFFLLPRFSGPTDLYATYADHAPLSLTTKSGSTDQIAAQLQAAFNEGDYQKALPLSETYLTQVPNAYDVMLARGISQLELGQYREAIDAFNKLQQVDLRINKASWYLAMTYLKMGKKDMAKNLLEAIVAEKGYNFERAKVLLGEF